MNEILFYKQKEPQNVVVLPNSVYHSYLGEYFLGQTNRIQFDRSSYAWGGLFNPNDSNVLMYLNAYTISNFAIEPITAEGWLSGTFSGWTERSEHFAAGNQAIYPPRFPKVMIQSASYVTAAPTGGTYTFVRRVEAAQTLTKHDFQGMYIIPPGSSFVLFFHPTAVELAEVKIAMGWWEEKISGLY
jgi:hypothetical protein